MVSKFLVLGTCVAVAMTDPALADGSKSPNNDATAISAARVSLDAAVVAAERHVQGKAVHADYEQRKGEQGVYKVEVAGSTGVFDVTIDAGNGRVLSSAPDKVDTEEDDD